MKHGIHHVTGVEHDETGSPSEAAKIVKNKWINVLEIKHIQVKYAY